MPKSYVGFPRPKKPGFWERHPLLKATALGLSVYSAAIGGGIGAIAMDQHGRKAAVQEAKAGGAAMQAFSELTARALFTNAKMKHLPEFRKTYVAFGLNKAQVEALEEFSVKRGIPPHRLLQIFRDYNPSHALGRQGAVVPVSTGGYENIGPHHLEKYSFAALGGELSREGNTVLDDRQAGLLRESWGKVWGKGRFEKAPNLALDSLLEKISCTAVSDDLQMERLWKQSAYDAFQKYGIRSPRNNFALPSLRDPFGTSQVAARNFKKAKPAQVAAPQTPASRALFANRKRMRV